MKIRADFKRYSIIDNKLSPKYIIWKIIIIDGLELKNVNVRIII